ncbi:Ribonuclease H1 [Cytospora mali]|uniref:ribonuclease H n=1 Tax=Cytospora mali TaxID=578113 RepID=A0A194W7B0_CYTMA|nr:Ribonuclease H1 [Valsa mali]
MRGVFQPPFPSGTGCPVDDMGESIERLFILDFSPMHRRVPKPQLITYTAAKQVRQLQLMHPRTGAIELDKMTVVVSIDGACRDNGKPTARASWGVYFGPGSRYNASGRLSPGLPQTSSRAEIEALSKAVDTIRELSNQDMTLQEIKIRCDSEYLCQAMSMWMEGWMENDGLRSNGQAVAHFDKLLEIQNKIDDMTYGDEGGLHFQFWNVPREENREADALANSALDG